MPLERGTLFRPSRAAILSTLLERQMGLFSYPCLACLCLRSLFQPCMVVIWMYTQFITDQSVMPSIMHCRRYPTWLFHADHFSETPIPGISNPRSEFERQWYAPTIPLLAGGPHSLGNIADLGIIVLCSSVSPDIKVSICFSICGEELYSRDVSNTTILEMRDNLVRQLVIRHVSFPLFRKFYYHAPLSLMIPGIQRRTYHAHHFDSINPRDITIQPLPPRNPALTGICQCDQTFIDL